MTMRNTQKPPRPKKKKKNIAISKILMAPAPLGPPRKKITMSPGESKARTGKTVVSKRHGKPKFDRAKAEPRKMTNGGDLAKMFKTSGRIDDQDKVRANKAIMDMARKLKPTGRLNTDDIRRVREMLSKGKKPVLDSKGKLVKNLFQKAGPGKPMTPEQKKQIERFKDVLKKIGSPPRRKIKKEAKPLMGPAGRGTMKGMRKPAGKMMRAAARRMKKTI